MRRKRTSDTKRGMVGLGEASEAMLALLRSHGEIMHLEEVADHPSIRAHQLAPTQVPRYLAVLTRRGLISKVAPKRYRARPFNGAPAAAVQPSVEVSELRAPPKMMAQQQPAAPPADFVDAPQLRVIISSLGIDRTFGSVEEMMGWMSSLAALGQSAVMVRAKDDMSWSLFPKKH